jgi:hypothetical protein
VPDDPPPMIQMSRVMISFSSQGALIMSVPGEEEPALAMIKFAKRRVMTNLRAIPKPISALNPNFELDRMTRCNVILK